MNVYTVTRWWNHAFCMSWQASLNNSSLYLIFAIIKMRIIHTSEFTHVRIYKSVGKLSWTCSISFDFHCLNFRKFDSSSSTTQSTCSNSHFVSRFSSQWPFVSVSVRHHCHANFLFVCSSTRWKILAVKSQDETTTSASTETTTMVDNDTTTMMDDAADAEAEPAAGPAAMPMARRRRRWSTHRLDSTRLVNTSETATNDNGSHGQAFSTR